MLPSLSGLSIRDVPTPKFSNGNIGRRVNTVKTGANSEIERRKKFIITRGQENVALDMALEPGDDITLFRSGPDGIQFSVYGINDDVLELYPEQPDLGESTEWVSKNYSLPYIESQTKAVRESNVHVKNALSIFYGMGPWENWSDDYPIRIHTTSHDPRYSRYDTQKEVTDRSYRWADQAMKTLILMANRGIAPEIYCAFAYAPDFQAVRFTCISDGRYTDLRYKLSTTETSNYEDIALAVGALIDSASSSLYVTNASIYTMVCRELTSEEQQRRPYKFAQRRPYKFAVCFSDFDPSSVASSQVFNEALSDSSHCAKFVNLLCFLSSLAGLSISDEFKSAFKQMAQTMVVMWEEIRHKRKRVLNMMCQSLMEDSNWQDTGIENLADAAKKEAAQFYKQVKNAMYRSLVGRDRVLQRPVALPNFALIIDKAVVVVASMFDLNGKEVEDRRQRRANADIPKRDPSGYMRYEGSGFD